MATIQDSAIFEYCETEYEKLNAKDNGYYPSKHDNIVFQNAANHFSMKQSEIEKIYMDYTKLLADIEIKKIKKLPINEQKIAMSQKFRDVLCNNKDLPFYKNEKFKELNSHLDVFETEFKEMIVKISSQGWTIPLDIDIRNFEYLKKCYDDSEKLNEFFENYYVKGKFNLMCRKIKKSFTNSSNITTFSECIEAFNLGSYNICITSLITLLEGLLSYFGDQKNDIRMMRICRFNSDEESKKGNTIKSLCWESMYAFIQVLYTKK